MMGNQDEKAGEEREISDETSLRICSHMNEDHAVSIYAMAKRRVEFPGKTWKISKAFLKRVTMHGCDMDVILCHEMMCQDVKITYPFNPPLTHPSQIRSRIIAIHHDVCTPFHTYRNPIFFMIAGFFMASGCFSFQGGIVGMDPTFSTAVKCVFVATMLGHTALASYGVHLGRKELKLKAWGMAAWYFAISLSGTVAFIELQELLNVNRKCKAAQKAKTK